MVRISVAAAGRCRYSEVLLVGLGQISVRSEMNENEIINLAAVLKINPLESIELAGE